ncbi:hypothetical protein Phum_PHUM426380 [Pediculus humanus corporis]|uniref:EGF-like domain-containing protein n=1 Tax=Pediculus humanus subsp. corporis TaxID=121224 RepID=E0VT47_PEDHC|nr:uncharacterized protein Phum_PHUM426380 [Pediculus humanus corporis]EEB16553.1 hypothetical protein Phum_PHUM426380 [Pediculus humanus corporis]
MAICEPQQQRGLVTNHDDNKNKRNKVVVVVCKTKVNGSTEGGLCNVNRGGCEHICTEVRRKVVCSCYQGFRLEGNKCVDIDECEVNNGGCEHTCTNQPGSFTCHCPTGLQLSSNGKTCVGNSRVWCPPANARLIT